MLIGFLLLALTLLAIPLANPVKFLHAKVTPSPQAKSISKDETVTTEASVAAALTTQAQVQAAAVTVTPSASPLVLVEAIPSPSPTVKPSPKVTVTPRPTPKKSPSPSPLASAAATVAPAPILAASSDLESLFTKYSNEYKVDKEQLKRIARCESNLNASAGNKWYSGLYQFSEGAWAWARSEIGLSADQALRTNPEEAIKTAAFVIAKGQAYIWPSCK